MFPYVALRRTCVVRLVSFWAAWLTKGTCSPGVLGGVFAVDILFLKPSEAWVGQFEFLPHVEDVVWLDVIVPTTLSDH